jgi:hypothetical protein
MIISHTFEKTELSKIDIHEPSAPPPRIIAFGDIHGDLQALVVYYMLLN